MKTILQERGKTLSYGAYVDNGRRNALFVVGCWSLIADTVTTLMQSESVMGKR